MPKVIGLLGGLGPVATIDLLQKMYTLLPVAREQELLRVLVDIDPTVPDRTRAIVSGNTEELIAHLAANARGLAAQGAELLAVACNTAHTVLPELQAKTTVPFVNMIEETVNVASARSSRCVGLLATDGTLAAGLYTESLAARGRTVLVPDAAEQQELMKVIYQVKAGSLAGKRKLKSLEADLVERGAEVIIAACTELPLIMDGGEGIIDTTAVLARALVERARGK